MNSITDHVERGLREVVVQAGDDLLERADGVLQRNKLALITGEDLRDLEGLRHETLDLTRTLDLVDSVVSNVYRDDMNSSLQSAYPPQTTRPYPR
jgi:hypothetical protein